ncbi:MAG: phosphatase [Tissierellia bacterium]|nr:phosphatase [Tissierellia bacterium]
MKNLVDLHCHTLSCGHAYSTIGENIQEAKKKGLKIYGTSEHGYGAIKNLKKLYFYNQKVVPDVVDGVRVLNGIEANIMDYEGTIAEEDILPIVDYAIASLHRLCVTPGSKEENTRAILGVIQNEGIDIIGHLDDDLFPVDYPLIVREAKQRGNILLEVNNSSLKPESFRKGGKENYIQMLECCIQYDLPILMSSDAHFHTAVGDMSQAQQLLEELQFPDALVLNYQIDQLANFLKCDLEIL